MRSLICLLVFASCAAAEPHAGYYRFPARLGLGKIIGTRTWGGEIWLSSSNVLADRGIATASEIGVYAPDGRWLIEGHGVDPDIVVDNLPHETHNGSDAQLEAAVRHLEELIRKDPRPVPKAPPYPDKSSGKP